MKSNLYKTVITIGLLLLFSSLGFLFLSSEELKNIFISSYANKIISLTVFYVFLIILLRNLDYILHKEFKTQNFFDNDIAASIYFSIRFLAVSLSSAIILM